MSIEVVSLDNIPPDSDLGRRWDRGVREADNLYSMYQSREWLLSAEPAPTARLTMISISKGNGEAASAVVRPKSLALLFQASRRLQAQWRLPGVEVMGGQTMGAGTYGIYEEMVAAIWREFPDARAIYCKSVPEDSTLWRTLCENGWRIGDAVAYKTEGERAFHYIVLPSTFDAYLDKFRKKQRYNLKRQVRVMSNDHSGALALACITDPGDVPRLIEQVRTVQQHSWKAKTYQPGSPDATARAAALASTARAGLLRAYVLTANGHPVAYALGYIFNRVYHYAKIGYDSQLAMYSPGNVLLFLAIQDLIENAGARFMNLGVTDGEYKRVFANRHIRDAEVMLLRPGFINSAMVAAHRGFRGAKGAIKDIVTRRHNGADNPAGD